MTESRNQAAEKSCILSLYSSNFVQDCKLVSLTHKIFTAALVVFYFSIVEKIPLAECLLQNLNSLVFFILWTHVSSCFDLNFEPVYWQKLGSESKCEHTFRIAKVIFKYSNLVVFVVTCALWPLLAWLNFGFTNLDTDFYGLRYFY